MKYNRQVESTFLSLEEQAKVEKAIHNRVEYRIYGGYEDGERAKVIFNCEDDFSSIVCLKAKISNKFINIKHSDVLGSLMALNIDRNQIGDIFIQDDYAYVYLNRDIAKFVIDNCMSISRLSIKFMFNDLPVKKIVNYQEINIVVTNLRIDCIVAALMNTSREDAKKYIISKNVSINHEILEETNGLCHNNDTISIRKYGRFILKDILNKTKKDRLVVKVYKQV